METGELLMEARTVSMAGGQLQYFVFPEFDKTGQVVHGFSTRYGGVSSGSYATLNLSWTKDSREKVIENRRRFMGAFGFGLDDLVAGQQVHGTKVAVVTDKEKGRGSRSYAEALPETDAMITASPGLVLSTYHADCVPLFFLEPQNKVVGLAHAGWKGTLGGIGGRTLELMATRFNIDPASCLVGIGPSIGPCCYEVGIDVAAPFMKGFPYGRKLLEPGIDAKWYLDLWAANKRQLIDAGVKEGNIFVSSLCTSCHRDIFFSYRANKRNTGGLAAVIAIRE